MKLLTRLTATLGAGTTRAVARFENHDAIADAAVRGAREAVATARVRHARLRRTGDTRRAYLATLQEGEQRWTERARASAGHDEAEALACLERRRALRERITDARDALGQHERLERETAARLEALETRLADIVRRRDALRSRESLARAGEVLDTLSNDGADGLEDVFERWEISIADTDPLDRIPGTASDVGIGPADDPLERRFADAERDAALRAELAALVDEAPLATGTKG